MYRDKKDAIKAQRGIQRAKTFDVAPRRGDAGELDHDGSRRSFRDTLGRRRSHDDDARSHASSRHRSKRSSHRPRSPSQSPSRPALTEANLKTHSEVSATAPRDARAVGSPSSASEATKPPASGAVVPAGERPFARLSRSNTAPARRKSIDMDLAYGEAPPDLESRADLDVEREDEEPEKEAENDQVDPKEAQALSLMDRIEDFLDEAQCMHQSASTMIEKLQRTPEAAAAVALALAELSTLVGKLSPAFLAFLKGGSPAVFALLTSPQFLIGAGVAAGVTVIIFGGWKIIKRIADGATKTLETPFQAAAGDAAAGTADTGPTPANDGNRDEAIVLREIEELSAIETWRRGIVPFGEDESADMELMSREAEQALREQLRAAEDDIDPSDSVSQAGRSVVSYRSSKTYRAYRSRRHRSHRGEADADVPERKSSKSGKAGKSSKSSTVSRDGHHRKDRDRDGAESEAASERSHRSHRSSRSSRSSRSYYEGSTVSRSSKHSARVGLKVIEEGGPGEEDDSESALGRPKEKKRDMIKQLFKKKKDKDDREKAVSVLV